MTIQEKIEAVFCLKGEDAEALEELIREITRNEVEKMIREEAQETWKKAMEDIGDREVPF